MQGEIEDIQRKSEMDVIRQRKINYEQNVVMQQKIIDLLEEIKNEQGKLKKEIIKQGKGVK